MKPEELEYIRYRLSQAAEALEDAKILLERKRLAGAVNRLYYACFYGVTALLFLEGKSATRHKGVLMLFDKHWIGTERFSRDMGRFLHRLFDRRQRTDYGKRLTLESSDVESCYRDAAAFVAEAVDIIEMRLPDLKDN